VQVLPAVRATQLEGLITGVEKVPEQSVSITNDDKKVSEETNPAYIVWIAWDQAVLGYIISSLTRETLMHVSRCTTMAHAWSTLADLYSSQTRVCAVNTRIVLATTKKNQLIVSDYYAKMCQFVGDLATFVGAPLRDDELVAHLLAGLDEDFNPVFTTMVAQVDPITPSELYAQLLSFEQHTNLQAHHPPSASSPAMVASRGRGSSGGCGFIGLTRGSGRGSGRGPDPSRGGLSNQSTSSAKSLSHAQCQLCLKYGHTTNKC
jgi:hypothetical protein